MEGQSFSYFKRPDSNNELVPWIDQAATLVQYYFSGQEGGNAIANVLFGNVNPSGKLTFTMPKKLADSPAHALNDYNAEAVEYKEGDFKRLQASLRCQETFLPSQNNQTARTLLGQHSRTHVH